MGVRIFANAADTMAVLYCSTSDWAFGPVITDRGALGAERVASLFLAYLPRDARGIEDTELDRHWGEFCRVLDAGANQCEDRPNVGPCEDDETVEDENPEYGECRWCHRHLPRTPATKPQEIDHAR